MKKFILLFIAFGLCYPASAQKVQSALYEGATTSGWQVESKTDFTYDINFNLLSQTTQVWSGSALQNYGMSTYTNNAGGSPVQTLNQNWASGTWTNTSRSTCTYTQSKILTQLDETWNSGWQNSTQFANTYDNNLYQLTQLQQSWTGGPGWDNSYKTIYSNDAAGNPTLITSQFWSPTGSTWVSTEKDSFTYSNNKVLTHTHQYWNGTIWQNHTNSLYTYDSNMYELIETYQIWDNTNSAWHSDYLYTYTNDASGNVLVCLIQWNNGSSWGNSERITYTYISTLPAVSTISVSNVSSLSADCSGNVNSDGGTTVTRGFCFNTTSVPTLTNQTVNAGSGTGSYTANLGSLLPNTTYYVRAFATNSVGTVYGNELSFVTPGATGIETLSGSNATSIYPSPATDVLHIEISGLSSSLHEITDLSGKAVLSTRLMNGSNTINISTLPKGVYFIKLSNQPALKFIKQ